MAEESTGKPIEEEPTTQADAVENRHGVAEVSPLLKGDRYQGSGRMDEYPKLTTHKPFTPYGSGNMIDQGITTPTQTDEKEEQGQPEGQQAEGEEG